MHRFFVPPGSIRGGELVLDGDRAHQINEVLRLHVGEMIAAMDGEGPEYRVELTRVARGSVYGRILGQVDGTREPKTHLVLYQSLLKADKFEWVLQKGTEIGISEFVPISTSRAVVDSVSHARRARWERIIMEAAEQSGRSKIPPLHPVQLLEDAFKDALARGGLALIPWEQERVCDLTILNGASKQAQLSLFIGPEGGFAEGEIKAAREHGVRPVTLGPRILRAETAGLVAASAILFALGELGANQKGIEQPSSS